jgi:hypothetical protein
MYCPIIARSSPSLRPLTKADSLYVVLINHKRQLWRKFVFSSYSTGQLHVYYYQKTVKSKSSPSLQETRESSPSLQENRQVEVV